jgi:hypothetical protein
VRSSVCPSVRIYQRGSQWEDFREIVFWGLLCKSVEKIQISLISDQKFGALYMKTKVRSIAAGDIKSPSRRSLRVKWYKAIRTVEEV